MFLHVEKRAQLRAVFLCQSGAAGGVRAFIFDSISLVLFRFDLQTACFSKTFMRVGKLRSGVVPNIGGRLLGPRHAKKLELACVAPVPHGKGPR